MTSRQTAFIAVCHHSTNKDIKREQKEQHTIFLPKNLSILLLLKFIVYKNHKRIHYYKQITEQ